MTEPLLATDQIQANIVPGFRFPFQHLVAIAVKDTISARALIGELLPRVTTMREALEFHSERLEQARANYNFGVASFHAVASHPLWINLAIGNDLFRELAGDVADNVDRSFKLGLHRRSFTLGDQRDASHEGHKGNWVVGGPDNSADLFLILGSSNRDVLDEAVDSMLNLVTQRSHEVIYQERGNRLVNDQEHFGFRDGVSQPAMRGRVAENPDVFLAHRRVQNLPMGPEWASPGSPLIWPGEFVFGYSKQNPNHFRNPEPSTSDDWLKNGSFLVFRRLKQDVQLFLQDTERMASELAASPAFSRFNPELMRASLVGRWPDGTPLQQSPHGPPLQPQPETRMNYFGFNENTASLQLINGETVVGTNGDPDGITCPFHAHIRKVNPRDRATDLGSETNTLKMRILRRGIPFGRPFEEAPNDINRGLLFLCYQTSIREQFEQLMLRWVNSTINPEPGSQEGYDMILGQNGADARRERFCVFQDSSGNQAKVGTQRDWVITTGGGYFFCPSIDALKRIAEPS